MLKTLVLSMLILSASTPAFASSNDAWAEFAKSVETACLAATSDSLKDAKATVDPVGSESYGLAVVTGKVDADSTKSIICVFDKKSETVEIGGELDLPAAN